MAKSPPRPRLLFQDAIASARLELEEIEKLGGDSIVRFARVALATFRASMLIAREALNQPPKFQDVFFESVALQHVLWRRLCNSELLAEWPPLPDAAQFQNDDFLTGPCWLSVLLKMCKSVRVSAVNGAGMLGTASFSIDDRDPRACRLKIEPPEPLAAKWRRNTIADLRAVHPWLCELTQRRFESDCALLTENVRMECGRACRATVAIQGSSASQRAVAGQGAQDGTPTSAPSASKKWRKALMKYRGVPEVLDALSPWPSGLRFTSLLEKTGLENQQLRRALKVAQEFKAVRRENANYIKQ